MEPADIPELEQVLKTLGNASRLGLLVKLQWPQRLSEIRIRVDGRPITRQAIKKHVDALVDIGTVRPHDDGYVVHHARLYELVERLRLLATVRAAVVLDDVTRELGATVAARRVEAPHLVVVRGVHEGATMVLAEPHEEEGWTLGRTSTHLRFDHDQFVSAQHARILRREGRFFIVDLPSNRNGTTLNWVPMQKGSLAPLASGDIIGVGLTLLVFRDGRSPDLHAPPQHESMPAAHAQA